MAIRVLIAEDSIATARILRAVLHRAGDITVVGVARDGEEAVDLARRLRPDIITMDLRLPRLSGVEATRRIMERAPTRVIVIAEVPEAHPERRLALDALSAGAVTIIEKRVEGPGGASGVGPQLIADIRKYARVEVCHATEDATTAVVHFPQPSPSAHPERRDIRAVGIGASTGGPQALKRLLGALPPDWPCPILVVQHIASGFTEEFASWLDSCCALSVKTAVAGEEALAGHVYVAPEDAHLGLADDGSILISRSSRIGGHRPSATFLFTSLARTCPEESLGVLLTGMGEDGAVGLLHLRQSGGLTFAQNRESCIVFGMPQAAARLGAAERIVDLEHMASCMMEAIAHGKRESTRR